MYSAAKDVKIVFTKEQEEELLKYVTHLCQDALRPFNYTLIRKLAYNYGGVNKIDCPYSWDRNQKASKQFLYCLGHNT